MRPRVAINAATGAVAHSASRGLYEEERKIRA
jgi:hypothetical protein